MKNYILLLLFVIAAAGTGCGDDTDENSIIGTWEVNNFAASGCDDENDNISLDFSDGNCFEEDNIEFCAEIEFEFKSDGTLRVKSTFIFFGTETSETESYNYSVDGNQITVCENSTECSTETFSINGDTLTFKFEDTDGCTVTMTAKRN